MKVSYLTICNFFLITIASSSTISSSLANSALNSTASNLETHDEQNKTKLIIPSEGGSLLSNIPSSLSKDNQPLLLSLEKDQVKNKEKSVVARKGVKYTPKEDSSVEHDSSMQTLETKKPILKVAQPENPTQSVKDENTSSANEKPIEVHKPLVLLSDVLDKIGENIDIEPNMKIKKMNENSRPDLVMPIVITILVLPMFAVVGYMAVKRGKEAWNNRHYKRMDFLLDGMYNE